MKRSDSYWLRQLCCEELTTTVVAQEEGTGYEMPNKSSKHDGRSRSLQSAADCLAQMCLQDKTHQETSGAAIVTLTEQQA